MSYTTHKSNRTYPRLSFAIMKETYNNQSEMSQQIYWIIPLALLILFEACADVLSKQWTIHRGSGWWLAAIGMYVVANIFWLHSLKNGAGLSRGAVLFSLCSEILALIIGLVFYKEHFNRVQISGMVLGVISIGLIFWE